MVLPSRVNSSLEALTLGSSPALNGTTVQRHVTPGKATTYTPVRPFKVESRSVSQAIGEVRKPYSALFIFQTTPSATTFVSTRIFGGLMKISFPPRSVSLSPKRRAYRKAVATSQHSIGQPEWEATDNAILKDDALLGSFRK